MVNFNGEILAKDSNYLNQENRGLRYGDALFETVRAAHGRIFFWEDHYLRLMASMRILRMEIPLHFTMEFLGKQLMDTLRANAMENAPARARLTVFRNNGGLYLPKSNEVSYIVEVHGLNFPFYTMDPEPFEVELFKDFHTSPDMLSTLKTNNKIVHVLGSIFAQENGYQGCLLLNTEKQVVEAVNGNIFLVDGNTIKTPSLNTGCINGILRKKLLGILGKLETYVVHEAPISPFELQKADELFITNAIVGIRPVTKYRKKEFPVDIS